MMWYRVKAEQEIHVREWRMRDFDLKMMMLDDNLCWERGEPGVPLGDGEVQVWKAAAEVSAAESDEYRALLAGDEVERMNRMRAGVARDEFVVGRGLLRKLVGAALGLEPRGLVFGKGRHGKPEIAGLGFNVSHSKGVILVALCRDAAVGVDVEWMDETIEPLEIARKSFSAEEYERIAMRPEGRQRRRAFYECWVRKEAVTKADGDGLMMDVAGFTVPVVPLGEQGVHVGKEDRREFFVRSLGLSGNFLAALALSGRGRTVRCFKVGSAVV